VKGLAMDTGDWHNAYVVGPDRVFQGVQNDALSSSVWTNFTGNLTTLAQGVTGTTALTAIGLVPVANGGALVAGSDHGAFLWLTHDATATWLPFTSFPNFYVTSFFYAPVDDALIAGTLGRGVFTIGNAVSAFSPVPEPAHVLLLCAAAGLVARRWRRAARPQ